MEFKRCYSCMGELPEFGAVCPHCGYDNTNGPAAQPSYVLPCGTFLNGQYVVGCPLGQGGFGITYIGYNLNLELPVCIKEYFPEGAASRSATQSRMVYWGSSENANRMKENRKSFGKEARKAVKLRDLPHIVSVWDVFYENETAYIAMDYVKGETLRHRLERTHQTLSESECVKLLAPVMEDLDAAHKRGIIHRDIKPDNIMLREETGEPVLLDMGAAKDLGKTARSGSAASSAVVVSQGFSPPEQYREHGSIGPWTDVYAMCATVYYSVTGKMLPQAIDRIYEDTVDFSDFTPAMAAVLRKGLSVKVEDRIQSMDELIRGLRAALTGKRQPRLWIAAWVAALLLVVLVLVHILMGGDSDPIPDQSSVVTEPAATAEVLSTSFPTSSQEPTSTPELIATPEPTATPKQGPGPDDIEGYDSRIVLPNPSAWLSDYATLYVQSNGGVSIYLRYGPSTDYDYFDTVNDGEAVKVLADQNGFSLIIASRNRLGWSKSSLLVTQERAITSVPSINETYTYWTFVRGHSPDKIYACRFHGNGTYSGYCYGDGSYEEGVYLLEGRRLTVGRTEFVWDGTQFITTKKYDVGDGMDYVYLKPDPSAAYEEMR